MNWLAFLALFFPVAAFGQVPVGPCYQQSTTGCTFAGPQGLGHGGAFGGNFTGILSGAAASVNLDSGAASFGTVTSPKLLASPTTTTVSAGNLEISAAGFGQNTTFGDPYYGIGLMGTMYYQLFPHNVFDWQGQAKAYSFYAGKNGGLTLSPAWATSTAYSSGNTAIANGNIYTETAATCTSAASGNGPSGTSLGIADGSCAWNYLGASDQQAGFKDLTAISGTTSTEFDRENLTVSFDTAKSPFNTLLTTAANYGDTPWVPSTAYLSGAQRNNGGNIYTETVASCTSAASGGPTGTGTGITDGTCSWNYVSQDWSGARTVVNIVGSINGEENPTACTNDGCREVVPLLVTENTYVGSGGSSPHSGGSAGLSQAAAIQQWCWGGNGTQQGALNLTLCNGMEFDVGLFDGTNGGANASGAQRIGLLLVSYGQQQGQDFDDAVHIGASEASGGINAGTSWGDGIDFGGGAEKPLSGWALQYKPAPSGALAPSGTIYQNPSLAGDIDLTGFEPTIAQLRTNGGTNIAPSGALNVQGLSVSDTSGAVNIDAGGYYLSGATVSSGGAGNVSTDHVYDPASGSVLSGTVSGGAFTAFSIITPGHVTSIPSNPITLIGGTGQNASMTASWTRDTAINLGPSVATAINIGNSGSTTTINGTIKAGASTGVSCSGAPTASFAVTNGIVTHC